MTTILGHTKKLLAKQKSTFKTYKEFSQKRLSIHWRCPSIVLCSAQNIKLGAGKLAICILSWIGQFELKDFSEAIRQSKVLPTIRKYSIEFNSNV